MLEFIDLIPKVVLVGRFCCLIGSELSHEAFLIKQAIEDEMLFILLLSYAALVGVLRMTGVTSCVWL